MSYNELHMWNIVDTVLFCLLRCPSRKVFYCIFAKTDVYWRYESNTVEY